MLIEVICDKFREKVIKFHPGLNVVLGDSVATNSIGKSTLLMVLDFIFGGNTFLDHNKDVVRELGDHDYFFAFVFNKNNYYFRRGTHTPDIVYECNEKYEEKKPLSIEDYKVFLKSAYSLQDIDLTLRSVVSLFSRVWGKENLDVKHPLHSFKSQKSSDCITNTIKLFKQYDSIKLLTEDVKKKSEENSTIGKAFKEGLIPKISKPDYKNNLNTISEINSEIEDIKNNLAKYAINIAEIVNREVMELKAVKDNLLSEKLSLDSRLSRVKSDLSQNKNIKSKHISPLTKFFPEVDVDRIEQVEMFHSKITRILRKELKSSEIELTESLQKITDEIDLIDQKIRSDITNIDNPNAIIDRVYDLSRTHATASSEIDYFETDTKIKTDLKEAKKLLANEKIRILEFIENILNDKTKRFVSKIYDDDRRSPTLHLGQNSYSFEVIEDTGTGKAYSNLILLDLAFLASTDLPFLMHDSVLFKNIQNSAVAKLVDLYEETGKQVFIAIDEIQKYGKDAKSRLEKRKVIALDNSNVLYIKDWRQ